MNRKLIFCLVLAAMCSATWAWDGTVINVNTNNTDANDGSTNWWNTAGWDGTPQWRYRTPYGLAQGEALPETATNHIQTNGDVFQSIDSGESGTDAMRLASHPISIPAGDWYYIYVFFWNDQSSSPWRIRAGLTEDECNTQLWIGYPPNPTGPTTPIQVGLDSAQRVLWAAEIGYVEGGQDIVIYTDDEPTNNSNERTWLDAYGYGINRVPEPITIVLLGLGGLLLRRRR